MKCIIVLFVFISSYSINNAQEQSIIDLIDTCAQSNFILDSLSRDPSVEISSLMGDLPLKVIPMQKLVITHQALAY